jgi:hypothetical protein
MRALSRWRSPDPRVAARHPPDLCLVELGPVRQRDAAKEAAGDTVDDGEHAMTVLLSLALAGPKSLAPALAIETTDEARDFGVLVMSDELVQVGDRQRTHAQALDFDQHSAESDGDSRIIDLSAICFALGRRATGERR